MKKWNQEIKSQGLSCQMRYGLTKRKDEKMTDPLDLGLELECKYCDYKEIITVPEADYISWHNGEYIQDAFPYLTAGQRELMLSNTCDTCWNKFFPMYVRNFEEEDGDEYNE